MTDTTRPTLLALVRSAVDATAATRGWLLEVVDDHFVVVAAVGPEAGISSYVGLERPLAGAAGFAAASGQPAALSPRSDDASNLGAGGAAAVPSSILAVPCVVDEVVGVLEVVDAGAGSFSFDDVELVTVLADVAAAALGEVSGHSPSVPTPSQLVTSLAALADTDPARYADVARLMSAMLR